MNALVNAVVQSEHAVFIRCDIKPTAEEIFTSKVSVLIGKNFCRWFLLILIYYIKLMWEYPFFLR